MLNESPWANPPEMPAATPNEPVSVTVGVALSDYERVKAHINKVVDFVETKTEMSLPDLRQTFLDTVKIDDAAPMGYGRAIASFAPSKIREAKLSTIYRSIDDESRLEEEAMHLMMAIIEASILSKLI